MKRDSGPCHSGEQRKCSTKVIQSSISTQQLEGQGTLACSNDEENLHEWFMHTANLSSTHWWLSCMSSWTLTLERLKPLIIIYSLIINLTH